MTEAITTLSPEWQRYTAFSRFFDQFAASLQHKLASDAYSDSEQQVLYYLASHPGSTAGSLASALNLDQGYVSRILAGMQERRLIRRKRHETDSRQLQLSLAARGTEVLTRLRNAQATALESRLGALTPDERESVFSAFTTLQTLLAGDRKTAEPLRFRQLQLGDIGWITYRHGVLLAPEFGWDIHFEAMVAGILAEFVASYDPACERSWVAERGGVILGSLFLVKLDDTTAKLRLLYVETAARGTGLATRLMEKSIRFAKEAGYAHLQLFTTPRNLVARRLYERLGFTLLHTETDDDVCGMGEVWEKILG